MKFNELLNIYEAGQEAGSHDLVNTDLKEARRLATVIMDDNKRELNEEIPKFEDNYRFAQRQAGTGRTKRKDMPVIDDKDVKELQKRLRGGKIDIREPFRKERNPNDPFPEGLKGRDARLFLNSGLQIFDGETEDDMIKIHHDRVAVGELKPIQKQIYFDKAMKDTAKSGAEGTADFMRNKTFFITSMDNYIIDGHHRYLSAMLIDPKMKVQVLRIDLPINQLLPLTLAYGDAVGNKRNK